MCIRDSRNNSNLNKKDNFSEFNESYNIFLYNLDTTTNELVQLTNELNNNIKIKTLSNNEVLFLSDKKGIFNLYKQKISSNSIQTTDFNTDIINFDYDENDKKLIFNSLSNGEIIISEIENFNINQY